MESKEPLTAIPPDESQPLPRYVPFRNLLQCGRAVKVRSKSVIYQYAGDAPQKRITSFVTKRAAREAAGLLLRDLRTAITDLQYNRIIDSFRAAINDGIMERRGEDLHAAPDVVDVACPECGTALQLSPVFADKAADLCPKCNAVEVKRG